MWWWAPGPKILGAIQIGAGSRIGANAVVVKSVPPESVVVGVPGQVVRRSQPRSNVLPDLDHDRLPDTIGDTVAQLMEEVHALQERLNGHALLPLHPVHEIHAPDHGVWRGEDFSI